MTYKTLLVGAGAHGFSAYAKDALPLQAKANRVEVIGVVEPDAKRREEALAALEVKSECGFEKFESALELNPDVVVVATPYFAHEEICVQAARAGCHLFIEKPVSDSLESCCRIQKAVEASGVKAAVNMSARFEVEKRALEEILKNGEAGSLEYLFGRMSWNHESKAKYRADKPYPCLNEGGVHVLEMLRAYAGGKPERVYHMAYRSPHTVFEGKPSSVVSVEMSSGVCFTLECSWTVSAGISTWRNEYIRADGERAAILLDHQKLYCLRGSEMSPSGLVREELADYSANRENLGTRFLFESFLDWLDGEIEEHPTSLEENMQLMALLFAAFESADCKQAIDVQDYLKAAWDKVDCDALPSVGVE